MKNSQKRVQKKRTNKNGEKTTTIRSVDEFMKKYFPGTFEESSKSVDKNPRDYGSARASEILENIRGQLNSAKR